MKPNKEPKIIADYIPVLQALLENYHDADWKSKKLAMSFMAGIGHHMNTQRDKDHGKGERDV